MPIPKVVGQPCPDCQTPFIQGPKGVYCKPCYVNWKNNKANTQNTPQNASTGQIGAKNDAINDAMEKKANYIHDAQDRKDESIQKSRSITGAVSIVSAMIEARIVLDESQIKPKLKEYTAYLYGLKIDESGVVIDGDEFN